MSFSTIFSLLYWPLLLKVIGGELQERLIPVPYSKSSTDQARRLRGQGDEGEQATDELRIEDRIDSIPPAIAPSHSPGRRRQNSLLKRAVWPKGLQLKKHYVTRKSSSIPCPHLSPKNSATKYGAYVKWTALMAVRIICTDPEEDLK
ncbi:unnamed protein product [Nesidiocoris tenuis]|uniref:Uncharacterized protein n=1 Tax=Nesidiocoris tenuis TaxID=355587 RepID=A0A6H5G7X0_9HEMI|nr:unnamed protein product [Nesidiocoris tenuis]